MEINQPIAQEGKIVFIRLSPETYTQLEELRVQMKGRGVATVIKQIVLNALKEGVTVKAQHKPAAAKNGRQVQNRREDSHPVRGSA